MGKQIAVCLSDDLVDFVDGVVAAGAARSRAALECERWRPVAARDAAILTEAGIDPDLTGLAGYAQRHVAGLD
ncbi:MAG: hypothetical protein QM679_09580 [Patulibacter sp.]